MTVTTFNHVVSASVARYDVDESLTSICTGTGNNTTETSCILGAASLAGNFKRNARRSLRFNTSSLGAGATITSAKLKVSISSAGNNFGGTPSLDVVACDGGSIAASYQTFGVVELGSIALSSISTSVVNDISLNASGLGQINGAGNTNLGLIFDWDRLRTLGGTWASLNGLWAYPTGTVQLEVTYTEAPTGNAILFSNNF